MHSFTELVELFKEIALKTVESTKPTGIVYGNVISKKPLKINIEQKLTLEDEDIILTRNITEYKLNITIDGMRKEITVHNELEIGDKVSLVQIQGGQEYVVLDRVIE